MRSAQGLGAQHFTDFSDFDSQHNRVNIFNYVWGLKSGGLWLNYKSLNTFNLTLNNRDVVYDSSFLEFFDAVHD